jgi:hypothetical protein
MTFTCDLLGKPVQASLGRKSFNTIFSFSCCQLDPTLTLVSTSNNLDDNLRALFRHTQHRRVSTLQRDNIHSVATTLATLARPANLDELALSRNRQRSIVVAHDVGDWEFGAAIVLCSRREGLDRMGQQGSRSVLSESRLDIVVKERNRVGDSRR